MFLFKLTSFTLLWTLLGGKGLHGAGLYVGIWLLLGAWDLIQSARGKR